jgi:hypothetical protein
MDFFDPSAHSSWPYGGRRRRRLYRRLSANYGRLSWLLTLALILAVWLASTMLTTTPERPTMPHNACGESYWEGEGRDGSPCP